jgi:peptidoglycan/LPS O-acetylase OafA/YrhL
MRYRHWQTLDGWRAISIAAVMVSHHGLPGWFNRPAVYGLYGVDVFFAISGFLITSRLIDEREQTGRVDLGAFYIRRCFRILPPYLAYLAVITALDALGVLFVSRREVLSCLTFTRNYHVTSVEFTGATSHFWSLAVEEHFYLLWPACFVWLGRRRAALFGVAACLVIAVWRAISVRVPVIVAALSGTGMLWRTDTRLDALLWGAVGALVYNVVAPVLRDRGWLLGVVGCFAALACFAAVPAAFVARAVGFAALIVVSVSHRGAIRRRVLDGAAIRWVGRLSYSMYIWQSLFMRATAIPTFGALGRFPVNVLMVFACASASYYGIEQPLIAVGRRLAAKRAHDSRRAPAAAPAGADGGGENAS